MAKIFLTLLISFGSCLSADDLMEAIKSEYRNPENILRDEFRNPYETLTFFGI